MLFDDVPTRALAVYAHPDDAEAACGATLARWAAAGCAVAIVVAAAGDKGTADPAVDPDELAARRAAEVAAAAQVLGAASAEVLGHRDGELLAASDLRATLVGIVRRWQPEVVVCPDPSAVFFGDAYVNHADHRAVGWATLDAVAPAAALPLYFPDLGPPHQVGTMLLSGTLEPDVWVDVGRGDGAVDRAGAAGSSAVERKVQALFCHVSQLADDADQWLGDFVRSRLEEDGRRAGVRWAEPFRRIHLAR